MVQAVHLLPVGGVADDPMRYKRIQYRYDLISGKVREVKYQEGHHDQFFHRYGYDADNRITKAETSLDGSLWHTDAEYFYYPHGPLQRVELGEQKVQGMDHAYTLQGWLKGINSELLTPENDMGLDGVVGGGNANELVGRDAYGLSLTYHGNDYRAIDNARWDNTNAHRPFAPQAWTTPDWHPLYNGNIAGTVHSLQPFGVGGWQGTAGEVGQALAGLYRYDQLNRLREMRTRAGLDDATNDWTTLPTPTGPDAEKYRSSYTYDANGNIRTADRWDQAGAPYDALAYGYKEASGAKLLRNRLYQVDDLADPTNALVNAGPGEQAVDILHTGPTGFDPQDQNIETAYNYRYDQLGNLTHDVAAHIDAIAWTAAGKVSTVDHAAGQGPDLAFGYGEGGHRISKQVGGTVGDPGTYREHYIRDAQGNLMATYRLHPNGAFRVQERPIYGSSRVGLYAGKVDLYPATQLVPMPQVIPVFDALLRYELTDHLGNVAAVVTGRLLPGDGAPHEAEVISAQGYEPFGSLLPGRNYSSDAYRFGFQGQEKDNEVYGSEGTSYALDYRMHDARVGRFLSIDPLAFLFPWNSPYAFSENRVLDTVELEGSEAVPTPDKAEDPKWGLPDGGEGWTEGGSYDDGNGFSFKSFKGPRPDPGAGEPSSSPSAGNAPSLFPSGKPPIPKPGGGGGFVGWRSHKGGRTFHSTTRRHRRRSTTLG